MRKQKEQHEANKSEQLRKVPNTSMGGIWIDASKGKMSKELKENVDMSAPSFDLHLSQA